MWVVIISPATFPLTPAAYPLYTIFPPTTFSPATNAAFALEQNLPPKCCWVLMLLGGKSCSGGNIAGGNDIHPKMGVTHMSGIALNKTVAKDFYRNVVGQCLPLLCKNTPKVQFLQMQSFIKLHGLFKAEIPT